MPIPSFPSELLYPTMVLYPSAQNLESILERGRDLDPEPRACGVETRTVAFCVFVVAVAGRGGSWLITTLLLRYCGEAESRDAVRKEEKGKDKW